MKVRHDNMLHLAHFLSTKTEPRLHYKPWEMSSEEQTQIDDQVAEARDIIQRERDEYEDRQEEESRRERRATPDEWTYRGAASPSGKKHDTGTTQQHSESNDAINGAGTHAQDQDMQDQHMEATTDSATKPQKPEEPAMDTRSPEHETPADELSKDADEEVVEAAEDTVIY